MILLLTSAPSSVVSVMSFGINFTEKLRRILGSFDEAFLAIFVLGESPQGVFVDGECGLKSCLKASH